MNSLDALVYWITEREAIRLRRGAGEPPPWTDDEILATYRFCNVRRMDDRVSRWLMDNWYTPFSGHGRMVWACALARFVNQPRSLLGLAYFVFLEDTVDWDCVYNYLESAWRDEGTLFNSAYIVTGQEGVGKLESVVYNYVRPLADRPIKLNTDSMRSTWSQLQERTGVGSFMAGQITADLRWAVPGKWQDRTWWAPKGPGSHRGMNRLLGRPVRQPMSQSEFVDELQRLTERLNDLVPQSIMDRLEAIDVQNCLCEFDKMCRVLNGEGRPKQLFKPREE